MKSYIMKRPKDTRLFKVDDNDVRIASGEEIIKKFCIPELFGGKRLPKELREKNWKPDRDKYYKYWYYNTELSGNGEDMMVYIEEWNIYMDKPKLRNDIIEHIYTLCSDDLLKLSKYLKI